MFYFKMYKTIKEEVKIWPYFSDWNGSDMRRGCEFSSVYSTNFNLKVWENELTTAPGRIAVNHACLAYLDCQTEGALLPLFYVFRI